MPRAPEWTPCPCPSVSSGKQASRQSWECGKGTKVNTREIQREEDREGLLQQRGSHPREQREDGVRTASGSRASLRGLCSPWEAPGNGCLEKSCTAVGGPDPCPAQLWVELTQARQAECSVGPASVGAAAGGGPGPVGELDPQGGTLCSSREVGVESGRSLRPRPGERRSCVFPGFIGPRSVEVIWRVASAREEASSAVSLCTSMCKATLYLDRCYFCKVLV